MRKPVPYELVRATVDDFVQATNGGTRTVLANFFAGDPTLTGGARVAAKNLDGDSLADLVVGIPTGPNTSVIRTYLGKDLTPAGTPSVLDELALDSGAYSSADRKKSPKVFVSSIATVSLTRFSARARESESLRQNLSTGGLTGSNPRTLSPNREFSERQKYRETLRNKAKTASGVKIGEMPVCVNPSGGFARTWKS